MLHGRPPIISKRAEGRVVWIPVQDTQPFGVRDYRVVNGIARNVEVLPFYERDVSVTAQSQATATYDVVHLSLWVKMRVVVGNDTLRDAWRGSGLIVCTARRRAIAGVLNARKQEYGCDAQRTGGGMVVAYHKRMGRRKDSSKRTRLETDWHRSAEEQSHSRHRPWTWLPGPLERCSRVQPASRTRTFPIRCPECSPQLMAARGDIHAAHQT